MPKDDKKPTTKKTKKADSKKTQKDTKAKPKKDAKSSDKPENTVFVGRKNAMTYVLAVVTCFNEKNAKEVRICARGRAISSAVDVAELTRNRFLPDVKVKSIVTSTEKVQRKEGNGEANVSSIEIVLSK